MSDVAKRKSDAAILVSSPVSALRVRLLLPSTLAVGFVSELFVTGDEGGYLWRTVLAWIVLHIAFVWNAIWSLNDFRPLDYPRLGAHCGDCWNALSRVLLRETTWILSVLALVSIGLIGVALGEVPVVGDLLFYAWTGTIGLLAFGLAAFFSVAALAAFPLLVPMTAASRIDGMTVASTVLSYVRRRPLNYFVSTLLVCAGTLLALFPFALFSGLTAAFFVAASFAHSAESFANAPSLLLELSWAKFASGDASIFAKMCWWWHAGFALASLQVGATRIFLCLRSSVDGARFR